MCLVADGGVCHIVLRCLHVEVVPYRPSYYLSCVVGRLLTHNATITAKLRHAHF